MAVQLENRAWRELSETRVTRSPWRLRGLVGGVDVIDTRRALLVWEPRRVTPAFAVPVEDVEGALESAGTPRALTDAESNRPVLDPSIPFDAHTVLGEALKIHTGAGIPIDAFRIEDPQLERPRGGGLRRAGLVRGGDAAGVASAGPVPPHRRPHDGCACGHVPRRGRGGRHGRRPRCSARRCCRCAGTSPRMRCGCRSRTASTTSACAYKGLAAYRSARVGDRLVRDLFWTYGHPLSDARDVQGLLGVYAERSRRRRRRRPAGPARTAARLTAG